MLASLRHFLRFVDLDETFDNHGFNKKVRWCMVESKVDMGQYTDDFAIDGRSVQDELQARRM